MMSEKKLFKKGEINNPVGRKRLPKSLKEKVDRTSAEYKELIIRYCNMNIAEFNQSGKNPNASLLELSIWKTFKDHLEKGNWKALHSLMDRVIGTVQWNMNLNAEINKTEQVQLIITIPSNGRDLIGADKQQYVEAMKEIEAQEKTLEAKYESIPVGATSDKS